MQGSRKKQFAGSNAQIEHGVLYFNSEDGLTAYDVAAGFRETIFSGKTGGFTVVDNGTERAVVTTVYDGYYSELCAYLFDQDTGKWSEGITLTDEGKYIRDCSLPDGVMEKTATGREIPIECPIGMSYLPRFGIRKQSRSI